MYCREVITGLNDKEAETILNNILGQISDGMWENSPRVFPYAYFVEIEENGASLLISEDSGERYTSNCWLSNPYVNMDNAAILKYFARKLKDLVLEELKNKYEEAMFEKLSSNKEWNRYSWRFDNSEEEKKFKQCLSEYESYIKMNPFVKKGAFKPSDEKLEYIDSNLADTYRVYKALIAAAKNHK